MEVSISRSLTPEYERAVRAVQELAENGDLDLSSVITPYDIIFLVLFAIIAIPLFISCVKGLTSCFTASKKVKRANAILDAIGDSPTPQGIDMDAVIDAINSSKPRRTTARRQSGTTQQQVTNNILRSLSMQRRNNS